MTWKSKSIAVTDRRTSKVSSISPPNKRKFVEVEFENMDVGQVNAKEWGYKVGDEVSYKLESLEWSQGDDSFTTVNIIDFDNESMEKPTIVEMPLKPLKFLKDYYPKKILFFDIECVRLSKELEEDSPEFDSWKYKKRKDNVTDVDELKQTYSKEAALYAEFGKVVCVSIGRIDQDNKIILKSFYNHDEKALLLEVSDIFDFFTSKGFALGGFVIKGYDVPFLMKRMLINRVKVPDCLDVAGAKPWEIRLLDTCELWKSVGFYSSSLLNVSTAMGLKSPKVSIDGKDVSDTYYNKENGLIEIVEYCERDVETVVNITMPMFGLDFITNVESKTFEDESKN